MDLHTLGVVYCIKLHTPLSYIPHGVTYPMELHTPCSYIPMELAIYVAYKVIPSMSCDLCNCNFLKSQVIIPKQPNLELTQEFGPTAFSVSSERHGQSGVNEIAQALKL